MEKHKSSILFEFQKIDAQHAYEFAVLTLNRPEKANSFHPEMITALHDAFDLMKNRPQCRALILKANGKHFCSGADLSWMKSSAKLSYEDNLQDAQHLGQMFERLHELPFPTIAVVQGMAAGGGMGLIACCDFAIASKEAQFSLKEVRVGLLPAMILPYLIQKLHPSSLLKMGLSGETVSANEALHAGLVDFVCSAEEMSAQVRKLLLSLFEGAPGAQSEFKRLLQTLRREKSPKMQMTCVEAIAKARTGEEGQKGLAASLNKVKADWVQSLPEDWKLT